MLTRMNAQLFLGS